MRSVTLRVSRFLSVPAAVLLWVRALSALLRLCLVAAVLAVAWLVLSGGEASASSALRALLGGAL